VDPRETLITGAPGTEDAQLEIRGVHSHIVKAGIQTDRGLSAYLKSKRLSSVRKAFSAPEAHRQHLIGSSSSSDDGYFLRWTNPYQKKVSRLPYQSSRGEDSSASSAGEGSPTMWIRVVIGKTSSLIGPKYPWMPRTDPSENFGNLPPGINVPVHGVKIRRVWYGENRTRNVRISPLEASRKRKELVSAAGKRKKDERRRDLAMVL